MQMMKNRLDSCDRKADLDTIAESKWGLLLLLLRCKGAGDGKIWKDI